LTETAMPKSLPPSGSDPLLPDPAGKEEGPVPKSAKSAPLAPTDEPAPGAMGAVTLDIPAGSPPGTPVLPPPEPGPASVRIGRFEVRGFLGEGMFGRVYRAHDPVLKREVALKVLKPEQVSTPRRVERFQREARAAANLQHPHIVAVFDSG